MPLPAFLPLVGSAIAAIPFRAALGGLVATLGRLAAVTFRSKMAWGLAAVWGIQNLTAEHLEAIPIIGQIKAALVALRDWADGKILGAFPEQMQPVVAFINYHVPISETIYVCTALANLYILVHVFIFGIWTIKQLRSVAHVEGG